MNGWMERLMKSFIDGSKDKWKYEWMDGKMNENHKKLWLLINY